MNAAAVAAGAALLRHAAQHRAGRRRGVPRGAACRRRLRAGSTTASRRSPARCTASAVRRRATPWSKFDDGPPPRRDARSRPRRPGVLTWASAGSWRSISATAAPRSPCARSGERCVTSAMRPVRAHVGLDGAATQDAVEWWAGLREAAREAIDGADADRDGAARGRAHGTIRIVGAGRSRRRARRRGLALGRHPRPRPRAGGHRRTAQHRRLRAAQDAVSSYASPGERRIPAAPTPPATRCCCANGCPRSTRRPPSSSSRSTTSA